MIQSGENVIAKAIKITEKRMQDALPWGSAFFCRKEE